MIHNLGVVVLETLTVTLAVVGFLAILYSLVMLVVLVRELCATSASKKQNASPRVIANELRLRQEFEDDDKKRRAELQRRNQEHLEWALANPSDPVGNRHLKEALAEYRRDHQFESLMTAHYQRMLEFHPQAQLDGKDYAALLAESEGKRDELASKILPIEMALGADALSDQ